MLVNAKMNTNTHVNNVIANLSYWETDFQGSNVN